MVNGSGVFIKTGGKFEVKSGQQLFTSGEKVSSDIPELPKVGPSAIKFLFTSIFGEAIPEAKVIVFDDLEKQTLWEGLTDGSGLTALLESDDAKKYSAYLGFDQWSSSFYDDEIDDESSNDMILEPGDHGSQLD